MSEEVILETTTPPRVDAVKSLPPSSVKPHLAPPERARADRHAPVALLSLSSLWLAACGGGKETGEPPTVTEQRDNRSGLSLQTRLPGTDVVEPALQPGLTAPDAARFLMQSTFGVRSEAEIEALQAEGIAHWMWRQFNAPVALHTSYLDLRREVDPDTGKAREASDAMSYEAIWRQWLFDDASQLRARVAFALSEIFVISNIAPDIRPYALSAWMDMLNRQAFGNYRDLLESVTLSPAMGHYLNMLQSEKENEETGTHPNENFAREVLQLFSIGLVQLDAGGVVQTDASGRALPTYDESVVKGFARAFTGWSFGGQQGGDDLFHGANASLDANWVVPMRAYASFHERGPKQLLNGRVLPAGQTPEQDMAQALDNIFQHPNVGPFIGRQLIQRLVTSNPSARYVSDVTAVFNDNGQGVRGDLKSVVAAILTHAEARSLTSAAALSFGKLREPLLRFTACMRAFNVQPLDELGTSNFWELFSEDMPLGQHPLLAPSVFNFFAPGYRLPSSLKKPSDGLMQDLVAPEAQITTETTVIGTFRVFHQLIDNWGDPFGVRCDLAPWRALGSQPDRFLDRVNAVLFAHGMTSGTRQRLKNLMLAMPGTADWAVRQRVAAALLLAVMSPDFVVQK